ncbi:MAG: L-rhamnose/proton symporter RhaT [Planctomycetaceae bacterium]|nr:L-rhamnose/proton symporter RhaT [Planctomycetaceae bacterium]
MNPFVGVFFHWLGGLASGSFYVPYRSVKKWSWEVYWLAGGVFSWIFAPWIAAFLLTSSLVPVLLKACTQEPQAVGMAFLFGMMWGLGGLTFGLTMRYLGMSLGMAIALGYCTAFGFLMPPLFRFDHTKFLEGDWSVFLQGEFVTKMLGTTSGNIILFGVVVCMLGIVIAALAGTSKEREMSEEAKKAAIKEFSFVKGLLVATFSGIMSAGMSYGMAAAGPIADLAIEAGTPKMWSELPRLCVILAGGFVSNFLWCAFLFLKNGTGHHFFASHIADKSEAPESVPQKKKPNVPLLANYLLCAIAGTTWYLQFFFYSMGETQMGAYQFSSWPLHMASIMIFSSLWGLALHEWKGSSGYTKSVLFTTLFTLILSTMIIGYGTHIGKVDQEKQFLNLAGTIRLQSELIAQNADQPEKLQELKDAIVQQANKIARFAPLKEGQTEPEDIMKRKIEGLLADTGLAAYEKPILKEGEDTESKKMTFVEQVLSSFAKKKDGHKLGQESTVRMIQAATALSGTTDAESIREHSERIAAALSELVGFLEK